jgi:hypothetical protein
LPTLSEIRAGIAGGARADHFGDWALQENAANARSKALLEELVEMG